MKRHLLFSISLLSLSLYAMNLDPKVLQMIEENRSITEETSLLKRVPRNCAICMSNPFSFYNSRVSRKDLLLKYVMKEPLMLNDQDISTYDDGELLREAYKNEQKKRIKVYREKLRKRRTKLHYLVLMMSCCMGILSSEAFCVYLSMDYLSGRGLNAYGPLFTCAKKTCCACAGCPYSVLGWGCCCAACCTYIACEKT